MAQVKDLKVEFKKRFEQFPGGFNQLKLDYQSAATIPQLKMVLAKIFKILVDL